MSMWKTIRAKIVGRGAGAGGAPELEPTDYNGYRIRPTPYEAAGGYQTAGIIEKDFADGMKEHSFVRAETHARLEDAAAFSITKAKQIIDQQGDRIFAKR